MSQVSDSGRKHVDSVFLPLIISSRFFAFSTAVGRLLSLATVEVDDRCFLVHREELRNAYCAFVYHKCCMTRFESVSFVEIVSTY